MALIPDDDDALQAILAEALAVSDPVPPALRQQAKDLYAWREVDALIAQLTFDSATDEIVGVRGTVMARTVEFEVRDTVIELIAAAVTERVDGRRVIRLLCHVEPAVPGAQATLRHREGEDTQVVGADGEVEFPMVPAGPVRLTLQTAAGPVTTEAVTL